jgi:hypothetical protein
MRRLLCLCLLGLAGGPLALTSCTFTVYEKELVVAPAAGDAAPVASVASALPDEGWMQFLDLNHIVDSIVELFKHTATKEAIRNGVHYTERKRFLHVEFGAPQGERRVSDSP